MPFGHALALMFWPLSCSTLETHSARVLYFLSWPTFSHRTSRSHSSAARLATAPAAVIGFFSAPGSAGPPPIAGGSDLGCWALAAPGSAGPPPIAGGSDLGCWAPGACAGGGLAALRSVETSPGLR